MTVVCSEYVPRPHALSFHARGQRFGIVVLHRRAGKTVMAINDLIDKAIQCKKSFPKYAYIAPFREQAKSIAWEYLKHYAGPLIDKVMESELSVLLKNGARIRLFGADNPDGLRGNYFDGVVLDEYAQIHPRLFGEVIGPALADRKGWIVFMGTPAGKNHFYELWENAQHNENWYTQLLKASESGIIDAEELELIRTNPGTDEATYLQEMECSFTAAVRGAIWAEYIERYETTNQGVFPYDPSKPVITAFDIGYEDDTSIWFAQANGRELAIIDFFSQNHLSVEDILDVLASKGYRYATGYVPHDAANKSYQTGKSTRELMTAAGFKTQLVANLSVQDGIQAVRATLPNVYFNVANPDVRVGLAALKTYQREWDSKMQIFRSKPKHDWSSNPADAFRYLCLAMNPTALKQASRSFATEAAPANAKMNLYDLFEEREARLNGSRRI